MKTITKTFYVDQVFFLMLLSSHKNKCEFQKDLAQFFTKNHNGKMREIQISWQEPEKKIEITESEFEKIWDESLANHSMRTEIRFSKEFYNFKLKLFGNN